ncbi:MAG: Do family serine endopeptidase [Rhodospirillaceae bacterium]|nr:Do family serine endopeptidase [Rhodospirillaceae bacterium]
MDAPTGAPPPAPAESGGTDQPTGTAPADRPAASAEAEAPAPEVTAPGSPVPEDGAPAPRLFSAEAEPAAGAVPAIQAPASSEQIRLTFAPLVADAAPAVVNIFTHRTVEARAGSPLFNDPMFRRFFGPGMGPPGGLRQQQQNALGSGVILRPDGLVVTNHHVIDGAEEITVVLADRSEHPADVIADDAHTDLAFLQLRNVEAPLPTLELADSDAVLVGDLVLAIGNPFGVGQTITMGIVSAQARSAGGISDYSFFIQTDAAINPGNSGGALIDVDGRLVGINTAIYSRSGGSMGIGFAIPSNMVAAVLNGVESGSPGLRPWLGADGQTVDAAMAEALGLARPMGVVISQITAGSPAARAGIEPGDVILAIDGHEVDDAQALRYRIATLEMGSTVPVELWRGGGRATVDIAVEPPAEDPPRQQTVLGGHTPLTGLTVVNLSPAVIAEYGYDGPISRGVMAADIAAGSPAARLGVQPRDIVLSVNGRQTDSVAALLDALSQSSGVWQIVVQRGERVLQTVVSGAY